MVFLRINLIKTQTICYYKNIYSETQMVCASLMSAFFRERSWRNETIQMKFPVYNIHSETYWNKSLEVFLEAFSTLILKRQLLSNLFKTSGYFTGEKCFFPSSYWITIEFSVKPPIAMSWKADSENVVPVPALNTATNSHWGFSQKLICYSIWIAVSRCHC